MHVEALNIHAGAQIGLVLIPIIILYIMMIAERELRKDLPVQHTLPNYQPILELLVHCVAVGEVPVNWE